MLETLASADQSLTLYLNHWLSPWLDSFMLYWSSKFTWIPLYGLLLFYLWQRGGKKQFLWLLFLLVLLILLSDQTASAVFKPLFQRLRPCHDPALLPHLRLPDGCGSRFGFASSHAANTMALAVFFALLPAPMRSRSLGLALFFWALVSGWSRIYLGYHFAGDVVCGFAIGAFWASALHLLAGRRRLFDEKSAAA